MEEARATSLFMALVATFEQAGLQGMGKLVDPQGGKAELRLDLARYAIDMLDMLKERTEGRRTAEEDKVLRLTLNQLQINFFETSKAQTETRSDGAPKPD